MKAPLEISYPVGCRAYPVRGRQAGGFAIVLTLMMLAILTTLVVAFLSSARSDRSAATAIRSGQSAELVAQGAVAHAVDLLRSNIPTPTHLGIKTRNLTPNTYTVNPGLLRVIDGASVTSVDLHSGAVSATPPAGLTYPEDLDITSYDLNAPVPGETVPAIVWPVNGSGDPVAADADGSPSADPPVMRVAWQNVVADPSLPADATNPIVSRYAFWIDDECGRLNYNIASGKPGADNNVAAPLEIATNGEEFWEELELGHPVPHFQLGRTPKSAQARGGAGNAIDDDSDFEARSISLGHPRSINIDPVLKEWAYKDNQEAVNLLKATAFQHYHNHGSQLYPEGILNYMTEARYSAAGGSYSRQVHPDDIEWYQKNKWNLTAQSAAPEFDAFGRAKYYLGSSVEGREGGGAYQGPFVYNHESPSPTNATDRVPYVNLTSVGSNVKWTRIQLEAVDRIYRYLRNNWPKGGGGSYATGGNNASLYQTALNVSWFLHNSSWFQDPSGNQKRAMALVTHQSDPSLPGWLAGMSYPETALWYYTDYHSHFPGNPPIRIDEGHHFKPLSRKPWGDWDGHAAHIVRYRGKAMLPHDAGPYITEVQFEVVPELAGTTHFRLKFRWSAEYYLPPYEQTWHKNNLASIPVNVDVLNIFGRRGPKSAWNTQFGWTAGNVADLSGVLEDWESLNDPLKKRAYGIPVHTRCVGWGNKNNRSLWMWSMRDLGDWNGANANLKISPTSHAGPSDIRTWIDPRDGKDWNFQVATSDWFYIPKAEENTNASPDNISEDADKFWNSGGNHHYKSRLGNLTVSTNDATAQLFPVAFYGPWDHDKDAATADETTIWDSLYAYNDPDPAIGDPSYSPSKKTNNVIQLHFQFRFGLAGSGYPLSLTPLQSNSNGFDHTSRYPPNNPQAHFPTWARPSVVEVNPVDGDNLPKDCDLLSADINISPFGGTVTFGWENTTDPRLGGNSQNWRVTNAGHVTPRFRGTMGAPNLDDWREWGFTANLADLGLWGGQDTSKLRYALPTSGDDVGWGWRIPWPIGATVGYPFTVRDRSDAHGYNQRVPTIGQLSFLHSGMVENVPWQSLNFGGKGTLSTLGGLPDWVVAELFCPSFLYHVDQYADDGSGPDEFNTISHMHSTAGKVNINTEIFPKSAWFNPPERRRPLEGVFYNLRDRDDPDEAAAFVTNILDAQSASNYFLYPGELTGVAGYQKGNNEWNKEAILRNMYSCLTTSSNTFGVWGVAQTVQKTVTNLDGTNDGEFEKGDRVTGERRFYALVERSIYPGKDGLPGNAHVDPTTGSFDRIASPQFTADYDIDGDGDKENRSVMTDLPGSHPRYVGHMGNGPGESDEAWWPEIDGPSAAAGVVGMGTDDIQWGTIGNQTDTYHGRFGGVPVTGLLYDKINKVWDRVGPTASTFEGAYNPVEPVYKYQVKYLKYLDE